MRPTFSICFVSLHASPLFSQSSTPRMIGGAEVQQYLLSQELVARGYPVSFVIKDDPLVTAATFGAVRLIKSYRPRAGLPVLRVIPPPDHVAVAGVAGSRCPGVLRARSQVRKWNRCAVLPHPPPMHDTGGRP